MAQDLTKNDIDYLADLARISISDDEKERMVKDLSGIIAYVSELSAVTIDGGIAPEAGALRNVMRPDGEPSPGGEYRDALLANAPDQEDGNYKMKAIF